MGADGEKVGTVGPAYFFEGYSAGPVHRSTVNWSGVVLQNGQKTWSNTNSFNDIYAVITVATAELPFGSGSCYNSGATDLTTVSFAGIDADNVLGVTNGQLQGGVFTDINCGSGSTTYYAYINTVPALNPPKPRTSV